MKIALIGYGKMGHIIEQIALQRGHEVVLKISSSNRDQFTAEHLQQADVVIEFTRPEAALANVTGCFAAGVPVVCGTTGWNNELPEAEKICLEKNTAFLHASNFSIGVNIFFEINKQLAAFMQHQPSYKVSMKEVHHTEKKDAPSGTAITIAEQIIGQMDRLKSWSLNAVTDDALPITAVRTEGVPGTHSVTYQSAVDSIEIIHTAHNREGFALGAVMAAEFLADKKGIFRMKDVLGIKSGTAY